MKFMLLMRYEEIHGVPPIETWDPEEVRAHIEFQNRLGAELVAQGELVAGQGLAGPETAKFVTGDGVNPPVVLDGESVEGREYLAGYWIVDVESEDRALEIAGQASAAPGPDGRPIQQPIEVRAVMGAPEE